MCVNCDLDFGNMTLSHDCVIYYQDTIWQWGVMAWTQILGMCGLDIRDMTLGRGHDTSLGHGQ